MNVRQSQNPHRRVCSIIPVSCVHTHAHAHSKVNTIWKKANLFRGPGEMAQLRALFGLAEGLVLVLEPTL